MSDPSGKTGARVIGVMRTSAIGVACPQCQEPLPSGSEDIRFTRGHNLFRCPPGRQPRVGELRCRGCNHLLIVYEVDGRLELMPNQASAREDLRKRALDDLADQIDDDLDRRR
ncbi:MAG: hypothetical protein J0L92_03765 [Deltaproteobacteria bacterium]|nr:hypothetical protein [Deltaproteobacteria bacterium]